MEQVEKGVHQSCVDEALVNCYKALPWNQPIANPKCSPYLSEMDRQELYKSSLASSRGKSTTSSNDTSSSSNSGGGAATADLAADAASKEDKEAGPSGAYRRMVR